MSTDLYGALRLPGASTTANTKAGVAGDVGLWAITDYLQTFLNVAMAPLWAVLAPGGGPAVRTVWHHDPEEVSFIERNLPALYLTRKSGVPGYVATDYRVSVDQLTLVWIYPPMPQARQRLRDRLSNAIGKAVDAALERYRFPAWVHPRDLAVADAYMLATPTPAAFSAYTGAGLNGELGVLPMPAPRAVTVTALAAVGAYALDPITIEGVDETGVPITEDVFPPHANGGWVLTTDTRFVRVTTVVVAPQPSELGSLRVGHAADDDALAHGSLLLNHAGLMSLKVTGWHDGRITIPIRGHETQRYESVGAQTYESVEVSLVAEERWSIEDEDDISPIEGVDVTLTGSLDEQASFD